MKWLCKNGCSLFVENKKRDEHEHETTEMDKSHKTINVHKSEKINKKYKSKKRLGWYASKLKESKRIIIIFKRKRLFHYELICTY